MTLKNSLITELGNTGDIVIQKQGDGGHYERVRANGADLFIGALVTKAGETGSDVDLTAAGEIANGVITGPAVGAIDLDKDADDAYADNTFLLMYVWVSGDIIMLCGLVNTSANLTKGKGVYASGGFIAEATVGTHHIIGKLLEGDVTAVTGYVYLRVQMGV